MSDATKILGPVTAYADAVKAGYTGTREQFGRDQAEFAKNATEVQAAKTAAEIAQSNAAGSAAAAAQSATDAQTAKDAAENAQAGARQSEQNASDILDRNREVAVRTPYVGENGNWFVWDNDANGYVDSGARAQGEKGNPGTNATVNGVKALKIVAGNGLVGEQKEDTYTISRADATGTIYGFHIDSSESDPAASVTYLADAVGMTPAAMDFVADKFLWGSWRDAFFMPRPCMLKSDGTVAYYLDPQDYAKKCDGTPSDVADDTYDGNAMMEWGQNGKKIWYKIVPDSTDQTSADVFIADYQVDEDYRAWSFVNNQGVLTEHFYTPIYNGSLDGNGKLRSISGKGYADLCQSKNATQEITAAELNNPGPDKLWYTEVYCDVMLIDLLLILMAKTRNTEAAYGRGLCSQANAASSMLGTGTMDNKGLFWGSSANTYGVKVFGMENWWGNQWRRYAGHIMIDFVQKYKMTRGRQDGSTADDYNTTANGYLNGATGPSTNGYVTKMQFDENCFQPAEVGGDSAHNWCDYWYQNSGTRYALHGGACYISAGLAGAFCVYLNNAPASMSWAIGAAPSCKPLS